jgi:hypothetical protein
MLVVAGAVMADFNADKDAYIANMGQSEKNPGQDAEKQAQLLNEYIEENKPVYNAAASQYRANFVVPTPAPTHHIHHHKHRWYKRHHKKDPYMQDRIDEGRRSKDSESEQAKAAEAISFAADKANGCTLAAHKYHVCVSSFGGCCVKNSCTTECSIDSSKTNAHKTFKAP